MMKPAILNFVIIFLSVSAAWAQSESAPSKEHQIKTAFVYNFIKFIDWPKEKMPDNNEPIEIGILGGKDFIKAFDPVKDKKVKNKNVLVKYFDYFNKKNAPFDKDSSQWKEQIEKLKECHVLIFCQCSSDDSEKIENVNGIVKSLENTPILTVGHTPDFLENGGIINFLIENDKMKFEINLDAAEKDMLTISSNLSRLAKRVIKDSKSKDN
jgi:hypothetical protein